MKFYFENFKGISNVIIDILDSLKPICLLVLNESGKTTILDAIDCVESLCLGEKLKNGDILDIRPKGTDGF